MARGSNHAGCFAYLFIIFGFTADLPGSNSVVVRIDFCVSSAIDTGCRCNTVDRQDLCLADPPLIHPALTSEGTLILEDDKRDPRHCRRGSWLGPSVNSTIVCVCDSKIVYRGEVKGDSTGVYINELTKERCMKIKNTAGEAGDGQVQRTKPDQLNSPTPNTTVNGTNPTYDDDNYYFGTSKDVIIVSLMCAVALVLVITFMVFYRARKPIKATTNAEKVSDASTERNTAEHDIRYNQAQGQYIPPPRPRIDLPKEQRVPVKAITLEQGLQPFPQSHKHPDQEQLRLPRLQETGIL